ncbi:hypothetical protein HX867_29960 [Pseudomonas gingeri]|uniref:hypothetical protein n=1 Tax=Pseudomonas gingeri TaxID=117681 RepID=UPI0015A1BD75|nr:hypothetical protein [Pseudomonas gingeri]NVZ66341.1 hypothetical protein [Pseudomonas gingeri]NVZ76726.1 hypothetical protein [Pseudomonas gingeri]
MTIDTGDKRSSNDSGTVLADGKVMPQLFSGALLEQLLGHTLLHHPLVKTLATVPGAVAFFNQKQ